VYTYTWHLSARPHKTACHFYSLDDIEVTKEHIFGRQDQLGVLQKPVGTDVMTAFFSVLECSKQGPWRDGPTVT